MALTDRQFGPGESPEAKLEREYRAFERLRPTLMVEHAGEYVAVHGGQVVAVGKDQVEVAKEAYRKVGYVAMYIGQVADKLPEIRLRSPRTGGSER